MSKIHPQLPEKPLPFSILLVDDSALQLKMRRRTVENYLNFEKYKFEIVTATDGAEAISQLDGNKFDLVITDFSMPNQNGVDLVREIRNREWMNEEDNPAKIMIVTTNDLEDLFKEERFEEIAQSIRCETKDSLTSKLIDFMTKSLSAIEEERPGYLQKEVTITATPGVQPSSSPSISNRTRSFSDVVQETFGKIFSR